MRDAPHAFYNTPEYTQSEAHATALMYVFGHCVAAAKHRYGVSIILIYSLFSSIKF